MSALQTGRQYEVEYRTVQNRPDWTTAQTLEYRGTDDGHLMFLTSGHLPKVVRLAAWQLYSIAPAIEYDVDPDDLIESELAAEWDAWLRNTKAATRGAAA